MPFVPLAPPGLGAVTAPLLGALFDPQLGIINRNIGGIFATVTVEEIGRDDMTITEHPVEKGAMITDHAFKRPVEIMIRAGSSASDWAAYGDPDYLDNIYQALVDLQTSAQPFSVVTGKRTYNNMLITSLIQQTDPASENTLMFTAYCKEIIMVSTVTTAIGTTANQANPAKTDATAQAGQKSVQEAPNFNIPATLGGSP